MNLYAASVCSPLNLIPIKVRGKYFLVLVYLVCCSLLGSPDDKLYPVNDPPSIKTTTDQKYVTKKEDNLESKYQITFLLCTVA